MTARRTFAGRLDAAVRAASWLASLAIAVYAASVVHDFYGYVDRAIYLSYDDGLANTSYALAATGRYGFPASPSLVGLSRSDGLFNYGPWYFFLGAGLIWLFGYSLTLLRSIHLWAIIGSVVVARFWFNGRDRGTEWTIVAVGALWFFEATQWPMARPDIMVSVFAVGFVVAAGLAISWQRPAWWFAAGLAAGCGALSHLVAWSLVPAAALVLAIATLSERPLEPATARWPIAFVAAAGGGLVAALMFYASFGFRFRDQITFLQIYERFVADTLQGRSGQTGYLSVLHKHFSLAYGVLPAVLRWGVAIVAAAGWVTSLLAFRFRDDDRRSALALVVPPLVAWSCYLASLGSYANLHSGYAILSQILALWTVAAIVAIWLRRAPPVLRARLRLVIALAVTALILVLIRPAAKAPTYHYRTGDATRSWVSISSYVGEVLALVPHASTAWGSLIFAIEHPDRVQLVDYANAMELTDRGKVEALADLAPEFVVWGYTENRSLPGQLLGAQPMWPEVLARVFPAARYRLVSIVHAEPYQATRVYVREPADATSDVVPAVSVYDPVGRQWLRRLGARVVPVFQPSDALRVESERASEPRWAIADRTRTADLPPGDYLLRVSFRTGGEAAAPRMIAAASASSIPLALVATAPSGDLAAYASKDTSAFLVLHHPGGAVFIGQFDSTTAASLDDMAVWPVEPVTAPSMRRPLDGYADGLMEAGRGSGVVRD